MDQDEFFVDERDEPTPEEQAKAWAVPRRARKPLIGTLIVLAVFGVRVGRVAVRELVDQPDNEPAASTPAEEDVSESTVNEVVEELLGVPGALDSVVDTNAPQPASTEPPPAPDKDSE